MNPLYFNHQHPSKPSPITQRAVHQAYLTLYELVEANKEDHIIFTSSGAEAVNHAVFSAYLDITRKTGKNHFLCTQLDEAPAIMAMSRLQELGCVFQMVPPDIHGQISPQAVAEMITPRTAMLSMSWANGLTGVIQPTLEISQICRERGILFHVEMTHVIGKGSYTLEQSGADLLSFSGKRPGSGAMVIKQGVELSPLILGGNDQGHMRGGSFSPSGLIEMAQDIKEAVRLTDHTCMEIARLTTLFEELIGDKVEDARVLFSDAERLPSITSLLFPGVVSDALLYLLNQKGVHATFGGNQFQHLMHVLKACGIEEPDCHCGLSFEFSPHTTEQQIQQGAEHVIETVTQLKRHSNHLLEQLG